MESRLQVRRVRAEYLVPAEHPSPERIKDRLDYELSGHLATTLSQAFASWFSDSDPSVWLVRRLDIDLTVNAAWSSDQLTRVFTAQFGRTLGATLDDSAEWDNVVRFSSRVAYLASFLQDLAAGHAWKHWYYESFFGLRMLATSSALRTAICDQSEPGREALLSLSTAQLPDVLRALSCQDADLVLDQLATMVAAGDEASCCDLAWRAWQSLTPRAFDQLDRSQWALLLYLTASRDGGELGLNLKRAALSLLCLGDRLASDSAAQREQLIRALTNGKLAEFYRTAKSDAEVLSPLLRCSPDWLREVSESINQPSGPADDTTVRRYTPFGGAFLLLPSIDELPLVEACRAFAHSDEAAAVSLVRFLLLIKCCGQRNAQRTFSDPLLRDLLCISPGVSTESIREWQSRIAIADVQLFLDTLLEWQRNRGSFSRHEQILFRAEVEGPIVLIDATRGLWAMADKCESDELIGALRVPLAHLERNGGVLLSDPSLLTELCAAFPSLRILSLTEAESEAEQVRDVLARRDKIPHELAHLALPDSFQVATHLDLALSLAAQHLMRAFAWQLPGCAQANLLYLWTNFLDFPASVEEEPERRVVGMGRPPLHLVLGFTGCMRQSYHLSWLGDRPFTLFEEI